MGSGEELEVGPQRIGIVVNEPSGDQLAAALVRALLAQRPGLRFEGMTGPAMEAEGCRSLARIDPVMGLVEVLKHLPRLLRTRYRLQRHFRDHPPELFIGVDAPDFNLPLERRLKRSGIKSAHLVSPTVWAWRPGRARGFARTVDLMLCLYAFEVDFLRRYRVNARYVGHPLADEIPLQPRDAVTQRRDLGMRPADPAIALLPGSRMSEVSRLSDIFIRTARWCRQRRPELQFVMPLVNGRIRHWVEARLATLAPELPVTLLDRHPREAIQAADAVLVASGTATLECLLLKRPMVVGYQVSPLTHWLLMDLGLLKIPHVALANLLSERPLAPEFLQQACRPEAMGQALLGFLDSPARVQEIRESYQRIHQGLRRQAAERAAEALLELLDS